MLCCAIASRVSNNSHHCSWKRLNLDLLFQPAIHFLFTRSTQVIAAAAVLVGRRGDDIKNANLIYFILLTVFFVLSFSWAAIAIGDDDDDGRESSSEVNECKLCILLRSLIICLLNTTSFSATTTSSTTLSIRFDDFFYKRIKLNEISKYDVWCVCVVWRRRETIHPFKTVAIHETWSSLMIIPTILFITITTTITITSHYKCRMRFPMTMMCGWIFSLISHFFNII